MTDEANNKPDPNRTVAGTKNILGHARTKEKQEAANRALFDATDPYHIQQALKAGADINARNEKKQTPLHVAAATFDRTTMEWLITYGADIEAVDRSGNRPLHEAARTGFLPGIKLLLEAGAEVNAQNTVLNTPLHLAAAVPEEERHYAGFESHIRGYKLLLKAGADVWTENKEHFTPVDVARMRGYGERVHSMQVVDRYASERDRPSVPIDLAKRSEAREKRQYPRPLAKIITPGFAELLTGLDKGERIFLN